MIKFCIPIHLKLLRHWYAKRWRGFAEHQSGWPRSVSENANDSLSHGILSLSLDYFYILKLHSL